MLLYCVLFMLLDGVCALVICWLLVRLRLLWCLAVCCLLFELAGFGLLCGFGLVGLQF